MTSALDRLLRKKPAETRIPICMDAKLVDAVAKAERELELARRVVDVNPNPTDAQLERLADAELAFDEAKAKADGESEWFLIQALADREFNDLIDAHKPTEEQKRRAKKEKGPRATLGWNEETFPNALIAACVSLITFGDEDPDTGQRDEEYTPLTVTFVEDMRKSGAWNTGEVLHLFTACDRVNASTSQVAGAGNG